MSIESLTASLETEKQKRHDDLMPLIDRALQLSELSYYKRIPKPKYPWWDFFFAFLLRSATPNCPKCGNKLITDVLYRKESEFVGNSCLSQCSPKSNAKTVKKRFVEVGYVPIMLVYFKCSCVYEYANWIDSHFLPRG